MKAKDLEAGRDWRQKLRVPHKRRAKKNLATSQKPREKQLFEVECL